MKVKFYFTLAYLVAAVLLTTAVLKWIYLPPRHAALYGVVGGIEALLALGLLRNPKNWRVWICLTLLTSLCSGFSLYTTIFGLPCSCMGSGLDLPRGTSLFISFLLLGIAWAVLRRHPARPVTFKKIFGFYLIFMIIGFTFASILFS